MTDDETICNFMEPNAEALATDDLHWHGIVSKPGGGWRISGPRTLDLDALWEVEELLTDEQWDAYQQLMLPIRTGRRYRSGHATAEQKIKAIAKVLHASTQLPMKERA